MFLQFCSELASCSLILYVWSIKMMFGTKPEVVFVHREVPRGPLWLPGLVEVGRQWRLQASDCQICFHLSN